MNDETPAKRPRESTGSWTKSDDPLRVSRTYRDRRRTKTGGHRDQMEMSLGDDGATAASPPTEKGAWYESGLLPSTEVEGNLLECSADGQVKPISAALLAAQREVCDEASLPFAAESQTRLAEVEHDALEKHLVLAYKALVHDDDASQRRNIVAYLAARCEVSHVANVVVNSSFVTLLLKLALAARGRRRVSQKAAPRPARVAGGTRRTSCRTPRTTRRSRRLWRGSRRTRTRTRRRDVWP